MGRGQTIYDGIERVGGSEKGWIKGHGPTQSLFVYFQLRKCDKII